MVAGALLCAGCNRDEESLFSTPAALRLSETMDQAEQNLVNATNGWEMLYFPNPESAGYSVLLKFEKNGQVKAATRNPQTTNNAYKTDDNSTWTIKADYGPILSFDTYNKIIHAWADPQTDGDGYLGDYEFLILNNSANCIRLKGKKHEAYITMYALPAETSWESYFEQVYHERELIVNNNNGTEFIYTAGSATDTLTYQNGMMIKDLSAGLYYPFVVRPNGIMFERGINIGGVTTYNFTINEDMSRLVCTDGINADFKPAMTLVENLNAKLDNGVKWKLNTTDMGSTSQTAYNAIVSALQAQGYKFSSIRILRVDKQAVVEEDTVTVKQDQMLVEYKKGSSVKTGRYEMHYLYQNDVMAYTYVQPIDDETGVSTALLNILGGGKGQEVKGAQMLEALMCGEFTITSATGSLINAQQLYWTSPTDANKRIKMIAQ